ncbi:MAG: glycosyltransferase family 39 protein [Verrucomicrobiota bacterium]|jgi:hypothetical protein
MKSWRLHWPVACLLLILLFVAAVRIRLLATPLERDEGEFAYAGQLMLAGIPPFRWIYNVKMPGIYAAYAAIMAVFGQTITGIHLGLMLVNLAAIALIFSLARRLFDSTAAVVAAATYALLSMGPSVFGFAAHATHFVVLAAVGGLLLLLRAPPQGGLAILFGSGLLLGLAFLMKQPGGAFAVFGFTLLVWSALRRRPAAWLPDGLRVAVFSVGVLAPVLLTAALMAAAGVWEKFWFWTVTYAGVHATLAPWSFGGRRLALFLSSLGWDALLWILAGVGLLCSLAARDRDADRFFLPALLLFSAAAVCPTFHFFGHYFVMLLPALALLAGRAVSAAQQLAGHLHPAVRSAPWICFALCWTGVAWSHRDIFFDLTPREVCDRAYGANNFGVYPELGALLNTHLPPGATLAVLGSEPELLFYAHRRSVTGYVYMYDLVQAQPLAVRMRAEMIAQIEAGRPDCVVFVNQRLSWIPTVAEYSRDMMRWLEPYLDKNYEPMGIVTMQPSTIYWGPASFERAPPDARFISVFHRKMALNR